tara:strand:+ start:1333 stop:1491 length:159 start_codon:yes stop_codon:yes gene_type:complete
MSMKPEWEAVVEEAKKMAEPAPDEHLESDYDDLDVIMDALADGYDGDILDLI